ncbi:MAG: class I SAM-dependent methyltransferase [Candidatus Dormiibacterota bacterium]
MAEPENPDAAMSTDAMREFWDARARENAMWFIHSCLDYNRVDEKRFWKSGEEDLDRTLSLVNAAFRGDERVLEIGCGIGRITRAIAARTAVAIGVDVSSEMVERGRQAMQDVANARLVLGNGRDLAEFGDADFDACYSFIVFQHIPDPEVTCRYIVEIGRVLKPGGWTLFQISEQPSIHDRATWAARQGWTERLAGWLGRRPRGCLDSPWLGSALSRPQLLDALERGGLRLIRTAGDGTQFCLVLASREGA